MATIIRTTKDFEAIQKNPGGSYLLANDITINDPIYGFTGTFDGGGHEITVNRYRSLIRSVFVGHGFKLGVKYSVPNLFVVVKHHPLLDEGDHYWQIGNNNLHRIYPDYIDPCGDRYFSKLPDNYVGDAAGEYFNLMVRGQNRDDHCGYNWIPKHIYNGRAKIPPSQHPKSTHVLQMSDFGCWEIGVIGGGRNPGGDLPT